MRRRGLLLLLALAVAVIVWIAWPGGPSDDVRLRADGERDGSRAASSLHAGGNDPDALTPTLVGLSKEDAKEVERGDVQVLVVGRHGQPLPNLPLALRPGGLAGTVQAVTDAKGRATLQDLPLDGSANVGRLNGGRSEEVAITGARVTLKISDGIPIRLALVDAETGRPGPRGRWGINGMSGGTDPRNPECDDTTLHTLAVTPGSMRSFGLRVHILGDGVTSAEHHPIVWVSKRARSLYFRCPVRREAEVYTKITGPDGGTIDDARVYLSREGDDDFFPCSEPSRGGLLRLRGIPFYRNVRVSLAVVRQGVGVLDDLIDLSSDSPLAGGWMTVIQDACILRGELPTFPDGSLVLRGQLPGLGTSSGSLPVLLHRATLGPPPGEIALALMNLLPSYPRLGWEHLRAHDATRVTAQVLRRDGSVHDGVRVRVSFDNPNRDEGEWLDRLTDGNGRVSLTGAEGRRYQFRLVHPGTVHTSISVEAQAGGKVRAVLQEAKGGTVAVRVVDPQGRGLPFAKVQVGSAPWEAPTCWEDEAKGIQRIDRFTDHVGYRLYEHVTPGKVTVKAVWADRAGEAQVKVVEGETTDVKIVLHPPK